MSYSELKKKLFAENKEFRDSFLQDDLCFEIADKVIKARVRKGLTQEDLAKRIGTKQSGISRLEAGKTLPSISLLEKVAEALGEELSISLGQEETKTIAGWSNKPKEVFGDKSPYFKVVPELRLIDSSKVTSSDTAGKVLV